MFLSVYSTVQCYPQKLDIFFKGYNFVSYHDFYWSSFLFLNVMLTVRHLSAAHSSNLLVTPCNARGATVWLPVVMYIPDYLQKVIHSLHFPVLLIYHWLPLGRGISKSVGSSHSHLNPSFTNQFSDELHHYSLYFHIF